MKRLNDKMNKFTGKKFDMLKKNVQGALLGTDAKKGTGGTIDKKLVPPSKFGIPDIGGSHVSDEGKKGTGGTNDFKHISTLAAKNNIYNTTAGKGR